MDSGVTFCIHNMRFCFYKMRHLGSLLAAAATCVTMVAGDAIIGSQAPYHNRLVRRINQKGGGVNRRPKGSSEQITPEGAPNAAEMAPSHDDVIRRAKNIPGSEEFSLRHMQQEPQQMAHSFDEALHSIPMGDGHESRGYQTYSYYMGSDYRSPGSIEAKPKPLEVTVPESEVEILWEGRRRRVQPYTMKTARDRFIKFWKIERNGGFHSPPDILREQKDYKLLNTIGVDINGLVPDRKDLQKSRRSRGARGRLKRQEMRSIPARYPDAGESHVQQERAMGAAAARDVLNDPYQEQSLTFTTKNSENKLDPSGENLSKEFYEMVNSGHLHSPTPDQQASIAVDGRASPTLLEVSMNPDTYSNPREENKGGVRGRHRLKGSRNRKSNQIRRRGLQALQTLSDNLPASLAAQESDSIVSAASNIQEYIDAWKVVKNNATTIIWPFLTDMMIGTNSSVVIGAAWSIYAHLIPTQWSVPGPFFHGLTSLPMLDKATRIDDDTERYLLVNGIINNLYSNTWNRAYNALDQSGYLENLLALNYAIGYHNQSLPFDEMEEEEIGRFFESFHCPVPAEEWIKSNNSGSSHRSSTSPFQRFQSLNSLLLNDFITSTSITTLANNNV